jgi:hypothetical protein
MSGLPESFVAERDRLLRELDPAKLREFQSRRDPATRAFSDRGLIAGAHKARLHIPSFSEDEKSVSRAWLLAHGFSLSIGL